MIFDNLKSVVVASQVATLTAQIVHFTKLGENTDTDYSSVITELNNQISVLGNV